VGDIRDRPGGLEAGRLDIALAGDGATTYVALLESFVDRDRYYNQVFIPALEAFKLAE